MPNMRNDALLIVACCAVALAGCHGASVQPGSTGGEALTLAAADAADGTVDHVISKCATCRLGMDGVAQYTATYGGYEMHFCSAECRSSFLTEPGAVIGRLPAPAR